MDSPNLERDKLKNIKLNRNGCHDVFATDVSATDVCATEVSATKTFVPMQHFCHLY